MGNRLVLTSILCLLLASTLGCYSATGPAPGDTAEQEQFWTKAPLDERIAALRHEIRTSCPQASAAEVAEVADTTIRFGELLADMYDLSRPPEHHNIKVRLGLKERGLCYELADDLYARLRAMEPRTLDLHLAITKPGHLTEEHNCVIVTDRGKPIETGVILDLWRYAGKARFIAVAKDHHDWTPLDVQPAGQLVVDDTGVAGLPKMVWENGNGPARKAQPPAAPVTPTTRPVRAVSEAGR